MVIQMIVIFLQSEELKISWYFSEFYSFIVEAVLLMLCTKYIIALLSIHFIFTVYKFNINKNI